MDQRSFQLREFCGDHARAVAEGYQQVRLGQTAQTFADGADGGRDGAFHGTWTPNGGEALSGNFTIQCKHTGKPGISLSSAIVSEELPKVASLAAQGLAEVYLLFTNHSLPAGAAAKLEEEIRQAGAKQARIFGAEWINQAIATNPTLRRLVPRLYGLGDLTQIITNQAYQQARSVLDSLSEELACFVPTEAYKKCAHALKECGFVILIGEPASGKTMIANLMALSAADEWNLQTLILNTPEDLEKRWNAEDPAQFFWVDDAFGANQYDPRRVQEWNQRLPQLRAAIHKGTRVVTFHARRSTRRLCIDGALREDGTLITCGAIGAASSGCRKVGANFSR